jgi:PncC family amidohydrolase
MDDQSLEFLIGQILTQRGLTLAAAESCTGGLVSHRITNVAGSSLYFLGGIVAYANNTKMSQLGVRRETLEQFGAVSKETVLEMARGVRHALKADIGIAVSGIAGPGGGTAEKPVGFTWIGLGVHGADRARQYTWPGDRQAVKEQSAQAVLQMLFDHLAKG